MQQLEQVIPLQQEDDTQSVESDESDDPLLLRPYGNVSAMMAYAGIVNAIPKIYKEAQRSSEWEQWELAIQDELAKMESYKVWEVQDHSSGQHLVDGKWVFTKKIDGTTGKPCNHKAR